MARQKQTHLDNTTLDHEINANLSYVKSKKRSNAKGKSKNVKTSETTQDLDKTFESLDELSADKKYEALEAQPAPENTRDEYPSDTLQSDIVSEIDSSVRQKSDEIIDVNKTSNISNAAPFDNIESDNDDDADDFSDFIEELPPVPLNEQQQAVYNGISAILDQPSFLCVLNAPAGTGKSTVIKRIIQDHPDINFHVVSLAAVAAASYGGLPSGNTRASSVFGNLFRQELPSRESPNYRDAFTPKKLREWEYLQRKVGLYAPNMEIKRGEDVEDVVAEMSKDKKAEKLLGVDFFEWFTCEVVSYAHEKWKNKHDGKSKGNDKKKKRKSKPLNPDNIDDEPDNNKNDADSNANLSNALISNAPILIIEEYSMVAILSLFGWMYPRMIFVGDKNQLPAIESLPDPKRSFDENILPSVMEAYRCFDDMALELAVRLQNAYQFKLTKNERDPSHQNWYDWLYDMIERHPHRPSAFVDNTIQHISKISESIDSIPIVNDSIYLCDTNKCRDTITKRYHSLFAEQIRYSSPMVVEPEENSREQDFERSEKVFVEHPATIELARYCSDGEVLVPTTAWQVASLIRDKYSRFTQAVIVGGSIMVTRNIIFNKCAFYNGEIYPVVEENGYPRILKNNRTWSMPYAPFMSTGDTRLKANQWADKLRADKIAQWVRVPVFQEANVMTIHKAQGQSLVGKVGVIITSPYFCSQQMLYTAATRCRNIEDLSMFTDLPFDKKIMYAPRAQHSYEKQMINAILARRMQYR